MSLRTAIEDKRARVAEFRRRREAKSEADPASTRSSPILSDRPAESRKPSHSRAEIDQLVDSLVGRSSSAQTSRSFSSADCENLVSSVVSIFSLAPISGFNDISTNKDTTVTTATAPITYSKQVQTELVSINISCPENNDESKRDTYEDVDEHTDVKDNEFNDPANLYETTSETTSTSLVRPNLTNATGPATRSDTIYDSFVEDSLPASLSVPTLSAEEITALTESPHLHKFLFQSWKVVSRAIEQSLDYDILVDYSSSDSKNSAVRQSEAAISLLTQFSLPMSVSACIGSSTWISSSGRSITCLDWSPDRGELLAVSYTSPISEEISSPKGLVCIWNLKSRSYPEYIFHASSEILAIRFSPFDPQLIFGSGYNGQIFVWDLRTYSPDAVDHYPALSSRCIGYDTDSSFSPLSPLSTSSFIGHHNPLYSLLFTGTHNSSLLLTASTDGKLCTWSPDLLAKPQDSLQLISSSSASSSTLLIASPLAPTCLCLSSHDPTVFFVGTEEGSIYQCNRIARAGVRAGVDSSGFYARHMGPVSALDLHRPQDSTDGAVDLSHIVLSCSLDWSIKLWSTRPMTNGKNNSSTPSTPLVDIQRDDPVYDVKWSPTCPELFASVDGTGFLDIWDILQNSNDPCYRINPSGHALNKLAWSPEGQKIAVGGLNGVVYVYQLAKKLTSPEKEKWAALKKQFDLWDHPNQ